MPHKDGIMEIDMDAVIRNNWCCRADSNGRHLFIAGIPFSVSAQSADAAAQWRLLPGRRHCRCAMAPLGSGPFWAETVSCLAQCLLSFSLRIQAWVLTMASSDSKS